jgi:hypothetical protein
MRVITKQPIEVQSSANGLVDYVATQANQNIGANYDEFSMAEEGDDFLSNFDGEDLGSEFSYAIGDTLKSAIASRRKRRDAKASSKNKAREIKARAKLTKAQAKKVDASSKIAAAKAAEKGVQGDVALAQALSTPTVTEEKKPMSTGVKVAIGVGVVLVLAGVGLVIYKMKKGK